MDACPVYQALSVRVGSAS